MMIVDIRFFVRWQIIFVTPNEVPAQMAQVMRMTSEKILWKDKKTFYKVNNDFKKVSDESDFILNA